MNIKIRVAMMDDEELDRQSPRVCKFFKEKVDFTVSPLPHTHTLSATFVPAFPLDLM